MTIYQIKRRVEETAPYFFNTKSLKFFGQTLKSFSVHKAGERFYISAPIRDSRGKIVGRTERFFNPATNELELS
jgi:hypothetical protein